MQQLRFINSINEEVNFTDGVNFGITEWNGLSECPLNIQSQQVPFKDGSVYLDSLLDNRELSFTVALNDDKNLNKRYELKREIISKLNPKLGQGYLYYKNDFLEKRIQVVPQTPVFPTKNYDSAGTLKFSISFIANNPYWEDLDETVVILKKDSVVEIENKGDISSQVEILINTDDADNPSIFNDNDGTKIQFNGNLDSYLKISTEFGNKSAKKIIMGSDLIVPCEKISEDEIYFNHYIDSIFKINEWYYYIYLDTLCRTKNFKDIELVTYLPGRLNRKAMLFNDNIIIPRQPNYYKHGKHDVLIFYSNEYKFKSLIEKLNLASLLYTFIYNDELYVQGATSQNTRVTYKSSDCINFEQIENISHNVTEFENNIYIDSSEPGKLYYSSDLINWYESSYDNIIHLHLTSLRYINNKYILCETRNNIDYVVTTDNFENFEILGQISSMHNNKIYLEILYVNDKWYLLFTDLSVDVYDDNFNLLFDFKIEHYFLSYIENLKTLYDGFNYYTLNGDKSLMFKHHNVIGKYVDETTIFVDKDNNNLIFYRINKRGQIEKLGEYYYSAENCFICKLDEYYFINPLNPSYIHHSEIIRTKDFINFEIVLSSLGNDLNISAYTDNFIFINVKDDNGNIIGCYKVDKNLNSTLLKINDSLVHIFGVSVDKYIPNIKGIYYIGTSLIDRYYPMYVYTYDFENFYEDESEIFLQYSYLRQIGNDIFGINYGSENLPTLFKGNNLNQMIKIFESKDTFELKDSTDVGIIRKIGDLYYCRLNSSLYVSQDGESWFFENFTSDGFICKNYDKHIYFSTLLSISNPIGEGNCIDKLSSDSNMNFNLKQGKNYIRLTSDSGEITAELKFRNKYIGV